MIHIGLIDTSFFLFEKSVDKSRTAELLTVCAKAEGFTENNVI